MGYILSTAMSLLWYALMTLYIYIHHGETNNRDIRNVFLVGGAITILKNMKVNWKDDIPYNYYGK